MGKDYSVLIKNYRKNHFLTQKEFSKKLGVGLASVIRWEHGEFEPTLKVQRKLDELFKKDNEEVDESKVIPYYSSTVDRFKSLINDYGFDLEIIINYLGLNQSDFTKFATGGLTALSNEKRMEIKGKIDDLYAITFNISDAYLITLISDMKNKYKLSDKTISIISNTKLFDVEDMQTKDIEFVSPEAKARVAIKLLGISEILG